MRMVAHSIDGSEVKRRLAPRPTRRLQVAGPLVAALLVVSCYPVTRMRTPRALQERQTAITLGGAAYEGPDRTAGVPAAALRTALADRLDLGLRFGSGSVELDGQYQLARGDLDLSVTQGVVLAEDTDALFEEAAAPQDSVTVLASRSAVYVGVLGDTWFSPWIAGTFDVGARDGLPFGAAGILAGTTIGLGHHNRLLPEFGLLMPVLGPQTMLRSGQELQLRLGPGDVRLQLSLAIQLQP